MEKITVSIPTGNRFSDGEPEIGREIVIEYEGGRDLLESLDGLSEDDYRTGLIDGLSVPEWIEKTCKENVRKITVEAVADYLAGYPVAEYGELRGNNMLKYNLYIRGGELVPPHKADGADRFTAWRDVSEYSEDETPERITATETLEDDSFMELCRDFLNQIQARG